MQGIPWSTVALGSLLLISACLKGGQEVQSPQPEKSKPPVKLEQRGRILGIGGVFFKSANRDQMREWYAKHLGLADKGQGAMLPWRLKQEGVKIDAKRMDESYGRFAWIYDLDGNKIELWQPSAKP